MKGMDLELLRDILKDKRLHLAIAMIKKVMIATDRSVVRVMVSIMPEQREIVAKMSWSAVGPEAGFFVLPSPGDLAIVGMIEGSEDDAFVLTRLTSKEDKIPLRVTDGDLVARALGGKKTWITSDTRVNVSRGDTPPTENIVLGQVLKSMLSTFIQAVADHPHIGNLGFETSPPKNELDSQVFSTLKENPVDNENILSDLAFTEK